MMFVILAYDIRQKRVAKIRKIVKSYLLPIQRSVFHGYLTQKQIHRLKAEILKHINTDEDAVLLYVLSTTAGLHTEELGVASLREWIFYETAKMSRKNLVNRLFAHGKLG